MALQPTTSSFRKGAIALATAAAILGGASTARAGEFTHDQCRLIAGVTTDIFRTIGANNLSVDFRQSMINFIMPRGTPSCDGPKEIQTPLGRDVDAFNTIRTILLAPPARISLQNAGLRSVASTTVGGPAVN